MSHLVITNERLAHVVTMARQLESDETGELNYPSFAYCIVVAVCHVFKASSRAKSDEGKIYYSQVKKAVWKYISGLNNGIDNIYTEDESCLCCGVSSCEGHWPLITLNPEDFDYPLGESPFMSVLSKEDIG